jgi:hypothetical protein
MIRIATVHAKTDRWIDVQLDYLERHLRAPFLVYGALNEFEQIPSAPYHHCATDLGDHAQSLNLLAEGALEEAANDDILLFIDGDAFPIAPLDARLPALLAERGLVAVRRRENLGDPQPHPCFCATTAGLWREIDGDWSKGPKWRNDEGNEVTDVGANVLRALEGRGIEWTPLLRSNVRDLHPVLFGVYADLVYHHGGGFRSPYTRVDDLEPLRQQALVEGRPVDRWYRYMAVRRQSHADNERLSELVFQRIVSDPGFAQELFMTREAPPPLVSDPG